MIKRAVLILAFWLITPHIWCQSLELTERESLEKAYVEGKDTFYATLQKKATHAQLENADRKKLLDARKKISGLYEHLMNFYYFTKPDEQGEENIFGHIQELSARMAGEFVDSIPARRWEKDNSALQTILNSTGFHARNFIPQFRKFLRPMTRRAKSQWVLKELDVRQAHAITKGKGVRLAIIDTGVDPTIKEVKSQIAEWKNFLDRSSPLWNEGKFPYDWGGHGTSIAAGINWAAQNGADIISLSIALRKNYKEIMEASEYCWQQNITVVAAAGNVEDKKSELHAYYPAFYPWSIGVGGVEKKDGKLKVWKHSARGKYIDVVAPATEVLVESPSYLDRRRWPTRVSGNSYAVSVVAATTALVLSAMEPEKKQILKHNPGALVEAVRSILRNASSNKKLGYMTLNSESGFGLINAYGAVKIAQFLKIKD